MHCNALHCNPIRSNPMHCTALIQCNAGYQSFQRVCEYCKVHVPVPPAHRAVPGFHDAQIGGAGHASGPSVYLGPREQCTRANKGRRRGGQAVRCRLLPPPRWPCARKASVPSPAFDTPVQTRVQHATHSLDRALVPDCPWVSCLLALPPARPALAIVLVLPAPVGGPVPEKSTHQL